MILSDYFPMEGACIDDVVEEIQEYIGFGVVTLAQFCELLITINLFTLSR